MAGIERGDGVLVAAAPDRPYLVDRVFHHFDPGQLGAAHYAEAAFEIFLVPLDLLSQLCGNGVLSQLPDLVAKCLLEVFGRIGNDREINPLLRAEVRRPEQVIIGKALLGLKTGGGLYRLSLADSLDPSGAQKTEREKADRLKIPAKRHFREFVFEKFAGGLLSVICAGLDLCHHLRKRNRIGAEDDLALFVLKQTQLVVDRRKARKVFRREQRIKAFLISSALPEAS